jgi:uncharacterized protein (TIGR02145 family)
MNCRFLVLIIFAFTLLISCKDEKSTSPTNNNIETVTIGTQVWMIRNLNVDHYLNGDSIPEVRDSAQWANLKSGGWCYYNNNPALGAIYGKLYNWYAVNDSRGLAPKGYHVPSDTEWTILSTYLGGDSVSGKKLKETGTSNWQSPNEGATNSSGFTALPSAGRIHNGKFYGIGCFVLWWSSTDFDKGTAYFWEINYIDTYFYRDYTFKEAGMSVRCIKDK